MAPISTDILALVSRLHRGRMCLSKQLSTEPRGFSVGSFVRVITHF